MSTIKRKARRLNLIRKGQSNCIIDDMDNEYEWYNPKIHISLKEGDIAYILKRLNVRETETWIYEIYPIRLQLYIKDSISYKFKGYEKGSLYILTKKGLENG